MQTNEKILRDIYTLGNKETRDILEKEFPSFFAQKSLLTKAIEYLTEEDEEVIKLRIFETHLKETDNTLAEQKLIVIFKWKNEKFDFDWNDSSQRKYFMWFYLDNFRYDDCDYWGTISSTSTRLCLKSGKLCEELIKEQEILNYFELYLKQ